MFKATVIICHRNYQKYLASAVNSAMEQTYGDVKVCVIDDSSDDELSVKDIVFDSLSISGEQVNKDEKLKIYTDGRNSLICLKGGPYGPSKARNIGIELYKDETDFFFILDADDQMYKNKVEKIMQCINSFDYKDLIGVVYADTKIINENNGEIVSEFREPYSINRLQEECIVHSGACISKNALLSVKDKYGYYDETMRTCEDYDLWMRIARKHVILHVPEPLTLVTVQPRNSTATVSKDIWERNWRRVHEKARGMIQ